MNWNKSFGVDFDPKHENHTFAVGCAECADASMPGDACIEFEVAPGFTMVKCNHILTVLDADGVLDHVFTFSNTHAAWHEALEMTKPETPKQFKSLVLSHFKLGG